MLVGAGFLRDRDTAIALDRSGIGDYLIIEAGTGPAASAVRVIP